MFVLRLGLGLLVILIVLLYFDVGCIDFIAVYEYGLLTFCVVLLFVLAC